MGLRGLLASLAIFVPLTAHQAFGIGDAGCSDGTREGFTDVGTYPDIAGCSGGWSVPGIDLFDPGTAPACPSVPTFNTLIPACGRQAGNDSTNPNGVGCDVADLCSQGWHVCTGAREVEDRSSTGCDGATESNDPPLFFATRQSGTGCGTCATGTSLGGDCDSPDSCAAGCAETPLTSNDFFGCGNLGGTGLAACGPFDRFSGNLCSGLGAPWSCTDDGSGSCEAYVVTKSSALAGGVLCCRDVPLPAPTLSLRSLLFAAAALLLIGCWSLRRAGYNFKRVWVASRHD